MNAKWTWALCRCISINWAWILLDIFTYQTKPYVSDDNWFKIAFESRQIKHIPRLRYLEFGLDL